MGAATTEFLEELDKRGHELLLETTSGTIRLDLTKNGKVERWHIAVDKGDVEVSHRRDATDCTVTASSELFDRIVTGEENAFAAALRGDVVIGGDSKLLVRMQRLFPSPPRKARR